MSQDNRGHDHVFGQDRISTGERRTLVVVLITAVTMAIEITAGYLYGSMALLADGLHMASHAVALGIAAFAYRYARHHAADPLFSFGTGKINALAGYTGAVLLGGFAVGMAVESFERLIHPVQIAVNQALWVATLGLLINGASVFILGLKGDETHHDDQDDTHQQHERSYDHNFRSAYFHVLADTLTSLLAIGALLSAKVWGLSWLDPVMGVVGALLVARWSIGLLRDSGGILLDRQADKPVLERVRKAIEREPGTKVLDLHIWTIGPGRRAAIVSIETHTSDSTDTYKSRLPKDLGLTHVTIEISKPSADNRPQPYLESP